MSGLLAPWRGLPTLAIASLLALLAAVAAHVAHWLMDRAERLHAIGNAARAQLENA